jgi:hypothetical protein
VRAGATANVGRTAAGFVNVVTKSGSNAYRGELFYFNRNRHLTSADAFGRSLNNQQNQFGGAIGGPIVADKAHFFVAAEQNFLRVPFVTAFQEQPAGVAVPAELAALAGEHHGTNNPTAVFARVDVQLSPSQRLNAQYTYSHLRGENFNFDSPPPDQAEQTNYLRTTTSNGAKVSLASVFGTGMLNEFFAQVATDDRLEQPNLSQPQIVIAGFGTIGGDAARPRVFEAKRYQVADNFNLLLAPHRFRFGFDFNATPARQERENNIQGRYDFASLADYEALRVSRYRQTIAATDPGALFYAASQRELGLYVQDRATFGALTVDAGLRWDGQWNPTPRQPNPAVPQTARIPNDLKMWQPRVGVAWSPGARGRTVFRATAGIYAARTPANLFQRVYTDNGITTAAIDSKVDKSVLGYLSFPNALTSIPPGVKVAPPQIFGFDPSFQNPRAKQLSAGVEHQLGTTVAVGLSYVHISTDHLQRRLDRNLFPPTIDATGMPIFPKTRPDPTIGILSINESTARARYDAMVMTVQVRHSRLTAQATYTLGWNKDDDSNERQFSRETALNPFDLAPEWTWSKQDARHTVTLSGVAELPWGCRFGAVLLAHSALPYTAVIGFDTQNDGNDVNDRAIIDGRVSGRNAFRQPSFFDLDLRLVKGIRVGASRRVDVIAELFNATAASNKNFGADAISNFGTPSAPVATAGQALFAPSTARYGGPRQLQLGARFTF